jgi:hypothetical protein
MFEALSICLLAHSKAVRTTTFIGGLQHFDDSWSRKHACMTHQVLFFLFEDNIKYKSRPGVLAFLFGKHIP